MSGPSDFRRLLRALDRGPIRMPQQRDVIIATLNELKTVCEDAPPDDDACYENLNNLLLLVRSFGDSDVKLLSEVLGLAFAVLGSIASKKRALLLKNGREAVGSMMVVLRCASRDSRCTVCVNACVCACIHSCSYSDCCRMARNGLCLRSWRRWGSQSHEDLNTRRFYLMVSGCFLSSKWCCSLHVCRVVCRVCVCVCGF